MKGNDNIWRILSWPLNMKLICSYYLRSQKQLTVTPLLNNMVLDKKTTRTPRSQTFKCVTPGKPLLLLLDQAKPFSYFNKILNEMVLSEVSEVACDYMELVKAPEEAHLVKGVTEAAFQEERWI